MLAYVVECTSSWKIHIEMVLRSIVQHQTDFGRENEKGCVTWQNLHRTAQQWILQPRSLMNPFHGVQIPRICVVAWAVTTKTEPHKKLASWRRCFREGRDKKPGRRREILKLIRPLKQKVFCATTITELIIFYQVSDTDTWSTRCVCCFRLKLNWRLLSVFDAQIWELSDRASVIRMRTLEILHEVLPIGLLWATQAHCTLSWCMSHAEAMSLSQQYWHVSCGNENIFHCPAEYRHSSTLNRTGKFRDTTSAVSSDCALAIRLCLQRLAWTR